MILHNQCSKSIIQPFMVNQMNFHTIIWPVRISTLNYYNSNSSRCKQNGTMYSSYLSNKISKLYNNKFSNNRIYNIANKWLRKHNNYYNSIQMKLHIQVVQVYQVVLQYKVVVIVVDHSCINHSYYQHFCSNQWLKQALVVYSNNSVFNNHSNKPLSSVLQMSNMKSQIHLMADIRRQKTLFLQYRHMFMPHR